MNDGKWIGHDGNECPVPEDWIVFADLGDGKPFNERAGRLYWGPGMGDDGEGRIARYFVVSSEPMTSPAADGLLITAADTMRQRGQTYDRPGGERSMGATVAAFNSITGHALQESEGWLFMEVLKAVRDFTTPRGHEDSQVDRIAYAALGAEARRAGR